jgi:hypothetical protein
MKRRKSKRVVETYKKYVPPPFKSMKSLPTQSVVVLMHSERTHAYPSHYTSGEFVAERKSIMDPMQLQKESQEVREAIVRKSRQIAPAFNKGPVQYVTEGTDLATLGRKI